MSLLTIATAALNEIGGFDVPGSFYGSTNATASQIVALCNREGRTLERECRWTELLTEHTFVTVADTATYAKPSDFRAFANMSHWDRTNAMKMSGPANGPIWQWLKSGLAVFVGSQRFFAVRGAYIHIYPTPTTSGDTIAFDYYSNAWVTKQVDSSNVSEWSADNDTSRLDEGLITLGVKWRFLQAKGMPYEPEYKEYESIKESLREDNGGRGPIRLSRSHPAGDETGASSAIGGSEFGSGETFLVDD
jgi:hypothetical protein